MSNPLPQRTGRRSPDPGTATSEEQSHTSRSHSELSSISLQLALIHLVSRVFPGMAFCGDTLPLGCQGDPSNGYTSAELAGTGLWNISETQRQRDKQTNLPSSAHLPYPQHAPTPANPPFFLLRKGEASNGYQPASAYHVAVRLGMSFPAEASQGTPVRGKGQR